MTNRVEYVPLKCHRLLVWVIKEHFIYGTLLAVESLPYVFLVGYHLTSLKALTC